VDSPLKGLPLRRSVSLATGSPSSPLGACLVIVGVLIAGADLALELARVRSCNSVATSRCLGGFSSHPLLFVGLIGILSGWGLAVVKAGDTRPLTRTTLCFATLVVPMIAMISFFYGEERLNPSDSAWDGRVIPIRLVLLVAAPVALSLAVGALNRGGLLRVTALMIACVSISGILPFAIVFAALLSVWG